MSQLTGVVRDKGEGDWSRLSTGQALHSSDFGSGQHGGSSQQDKHCSE